MHLRTIRSGAVIIAAAVLLCAPLPARGEEARRVVVAEFMGPIPSSKLVRKAVYEIVSDFYEVLPYSKYRIARRRLNITDDSMRAVATVARRVGADAIIEGELRGRQLTVSVREGRTGRVMDRFKVTVQGSGVSEETRERITDELVDLIDWTEPISRGAQGAAADPTAIRDPSDDEAPPPTRVAAAEPATAELSAAHRKPAVMAKKWTLDDDPSSGKPKGKQRPPAIQVGAAVGVAATSRQLQFSHQPDLAEEERPLGMAGSPSAGVAFAGNFDINPLKVSADVLYKRSIGASVSYPSGGQTKKLSVALSHIGGRLSIRRLVKGRVTLRGGAGYHQFSFGISRRPTGLLMPDARYAVAEVGGGARLGLRDDRIALTADLSYLHVLSASGITAATAYGSARFQGFGGEAGLEIQAGDTTYVRVAGTYERITLAFNGDGDLTTGLDGSSDVDVSGAADTLIGFAIMLGFRL
jgi:hypothetical protein